MIFVMVWILASGVPVQIGFKTQDLCEAARVRLAAEYGVPAAATVCLQVGAEWEDYL